MILLAGDHPELPLLLAGLRIEAGHEAAGAELGAAVADDHHALDHARRAGDRQPGGLGEGLGRPDFLAGLGVQRDQPPVQRADEHLVAPDRHAAVGRRAAGVDLPVAGLGHIAPHFLAAARVEGPHLGEVGRHIDHAVMHDRRGLQPLAVAEVVVPGQAQLADGRGVDLGQGAEALLAVAAAVVQPFAGGLVDVDDAGRRDPARSRRRRALPADAGDGRHGRRRGGPPGQTRPACAHACLPATRRRGSAAPVACFIFLRAEYWARDPCRRCRSSPDRPWRRRSGSGRRGE